MYIHQTTEQAVEENLSKTIYIYIGYKYNIQARWTAVNTWRSNENTQVK